MQELRARDAVLFLQAPPVGSPRIGRLTEGGQETGGGDGATVVWAVGDGADGSDQAKEVADLIADDEPDRLLYLGDVYETGTAEEFDENYDSVYGDLAEITEPTPGNH